METWSADDWGKLLGYVGTLITVISVAVAKVISVIKRELRQHETQAASRFARTLGNINRPARPRGRGDQENPDD
jgi:ABC-type protease/lipase transport system fused ATPase/permease subunit